LQSYSHQLFAKCLDKRNLKRLNRKKEKEKEKRNLKINDVLFLYFGGAWAFGKLWGFSQWVS